MSLHPSCWPKLYVIGWTTLQPSPLNKPQCVTWVERRDTRETFSRVSPRSTGVTPTSHIREVRP